MPPRQLYGLPIAARRPRAVSLSAIVLALAASEASAQLAVSANDGKVKLVDGVVQTVSDGRDTIAIVDLSQNPPRIITEVAAPTSIVGPPTSVAVGPRGDIALVTSAEKIDPADPTKRVPNDVVTVLDISALKPSITQQVKRIVLRAPAAEAAPPKIVATLKVGAGASGVSINKAGTLALVANRLDGTVTVLAIKGTEVTVVGKVEVGDAKSGPSAVAFAPDGRTAYVTLDGDASNKIAVLAIEGTTVSYTKRDMFAGLRPYGIDVAQKGDYAVVANIGRSNGDSDTISLIDTKLQPSRVVATATVGQTPEGIKISPDSAYIAVTVMNGSNKAKSSPFFREAGLLQIWRRAAQGGGLEKVAEAPIGRWCQGIAWAKDSKSLIVQCAVEEELIAFRFAGLGTRTLTRTTAIKVKGAPAGIRTIE